MLLQCLARPLAGLILYLVSFAAPAQQPSLPAVPPPAVAATSWLLVDLTSTQTLAAHNTAERRDPASLTKLMTAYLAFSALKQKLITLEQSVKVSTKAWKAEGSRMFIEPNRPVTVDELLRGMIVQSGNDASVALAEVIAGSEEAFAQAMTREAQRLGMKNTNFVNATGLSHPQHYSTAADLALLAAAIIRDFPDNYALYSIKEYKYNNIAQPNRNRLLWTDQYVDGMKTGFTDAAGYCLIASARRGPRRLLTVVMGAASDSARAIESQKLLNFGFQFYDTPRLYEKNQVVTALPVWKGVGATLNAGFTDDLYLSLPKGVGPKLKVAMEARQPLTAPIALGQTVGVLRLTLDGNAVAEFPLQALQEMPQAGIFGRAWDSIRLWFR
ncbi:MAG: D-alanyl-D-alanine carboxypeptidase [Betaproteobacteria bacterium]|nr:D-alanyl-D-alanine carboxypeptidase [Betaproteobacteria bacterium]